jgi:general stress protein 26
VWCARAAAWCPAGRDAPDLGLLQVSSDSAQHWGTPGGAAARLAGIVRAKATGERPTGSTSTTEL